MKAATGISGAGYDTIIDECAEAAAADVEQILQGRRFIPYISTNEYVSEGSDLDCGPASWLFVDDLLSVTSIKIDENLDGSFAETALAATDYRLQPRTAPGLGRPYTALELPTYGTKSAYINGYRFQIIGTWGYSQTTKAAGTLSAAIADAVATSCTVSDEAAIDVGDTLLIDSEQLFVSEEQNKTLTIVRGVNGTTAAAHSNAAAIRKYAPPGDIAAYCRAHVIHSYQQGRSGWRGISDGGDTVGVDPTRMPAGLWKMREDIKTKYGRVRF